MRNSSPNGRHTFPRYHISVLITQKGEPSISPSTMFTLNSHTLAAIHQQGAEIKSKGGYKEGMSR